MIAAEDRICFECAATRCAAEAWVTVARRLAAVAKTDPFDPLLVFTACTSRASIRFTAEAEFATRLAETLVAA